MTADDCRRPRLALPFTVLPAPDTIRLVAGEDFRYTLTGGGIETWLPALLAQCDGRLSLAELLSLLDADRRAAGRALVERLYGERVLVDGPASAGYEPRRVRLAVEGTGPLAGALRAHPCDATLPALPVLCQDRLDYEEALRFNRRCRDSLSPWLWATTGPVQRGYVGPLFLPDAGPCLGCLLNHFRRLSPAPELYDALRRHAQDGAELKPGSFPTEAVEILKQLVLWKASLLAQPQPAALYRLHVLEVETLEITAHRVFIDPECPECSEPAYDGLV